MGIVALCRGLELLSCWTGFAARHGSGPAFQGAFYVFAFATAGIVVAVRFNWRNSRVGFWLNAVQVGVADVPFILFVVVPGYVPFWPGVAGPALWIAAVIMTGLMRHSTSIHASA